MAWRRLDEVPADLSSARASLDGGRFAAWWPAGEARGDNPGVGGAWSYTVTLADGTERRV